jgi:hypothetical protein
MPHRYQCSPTSIKTACRPQDGIAPQIIKLRQRGHLNKGNVDLAAFIARLRSHLAKILIIVK